MLPGFCGGSIHPTLMAVFFSRPECWASYTICHQVCNLARIAGNNTQELYLEVSLAGQHRVYVPCESESKWSASLTCRNSSSISGRKTASGCLAAGVWADSDCTALASRLARRLQALSSCSWACSSSCVETFKVSMVINGCVCGGWVGGGSKGRKGSKETSFHGGETCVYVRV